MQKYTHPQSNVILKMVIAYVHQLQTLQSIFLPITQVQTITIIQAITPKDFLLINQKKKTKIYFSIIFFKKNSPPNKSLYLSRNKLGEKRI